MKLFEFFHVALQVLTLTGAVQPGKRSGSLALHLQPKNVPFRDLLRPFLAASIAELENTAAEAMAYVVRWNGRGITLDGSAALANGVFLHLERDFEAAASFEDIKQTFYNDQMVMFNLLGVEAVEA